MKTETFITLIAALCIVATIGLMSNCSIQVARTNAESMCNSHGGFWDNLNNRCVGGK